MLNSRVILARPENISQDLPTYSLAPSFSKQASVLLRLKDCVNPVICHLVLRPEPINFSISNTCIIIEEIISCYGAQLISQLRSLTRKKVPVAKSVTKNSPGILSRIFSNLHSCSLVIHSKGDFVLNDQVPRSMNQRN